MGPHPEIYQNLLDILNSLSQQIGAMKNAKGQMQPAGKDSSGLPSVSAPGSVLKALKRPKGKAGGKRKTIKAPSVAEANGGSVLNPGLVAANEDGSGVNYTDRNGNDIRLHGNSKYCTMLLFFALLNCPLLLLSFLFCIAFSQITGYQN